MENLKLDFTDVARPTLYTMFKQTTEARVFRRAEAVRDVVKGQRLQTVSDTHQFTYSALRKWVHRFAHHGTQGLIDRPRSGRPPKVTCELAMHLNRLVDQDPVQHGSISSQWRCQELATVLARQTGVQLSRESVRDVLKKKPSTPAVPRGVLILPRLLSPTALAHARLSSIGLVRGRALCS